MERFLALSSTLVGTDYARVIPLVVLVALGGWAFRQLSGKPVLVELPRLAGWVWAKLGQRGRYDGRSPRWLKREICRLGFIVDYTIVALLGVVLLLQSFLYWLHPGGPAKNFDWLAYFFFMIVGMRQFKILGDDELYSFRRLRLRRRRV
jgi:hypothetical protein